MSYRVAVVKWKDSDEIAEGIACELAALGHQPTLFCFDAALPLPADVVLTFAPYGRLQQLARRIETMAPARRPLWVHWNTENPPSLGAPWGLLRPLCALRSWADRLCDAETPLARAIAGNARFAAANRRMARLRYIGDYHYANDHGLLNALIESSRVFAAWNRARGLPAEYVPWGTLRTYYAPLALPRDIDVLWMGQRRTRRRSDLIERVRDGVTCRGYTMHVADGVENPFVFGPSRTRLLNRTRIILNVLARARHDNIFPYRFHVAAGNGALVVSEPELDHCPSYMAGVHYVAAGETDLVETVLHYLADEDARAKIAERAFHLATDEMCFAASVQGVVKVIDRCSRGRVA